MTRLTVDRTMQEKLTAVSEAVEVCDEAGDILG